LETEWSMFLKILAFVLPNLLAILALPALREWLYTLIYTWLAIGWVDG
jgi:hypothetical protein